MRPSRVPRIALIAPIAPLLGAFGLACAPTAPPPVQQPVAIENTALGLRLAHLPEGATVAVDEGARWTLDAPIGKTKGTITIEIRPTDSKNVNLVAEARGAGEAAAALPGGKFFGGNELVTPGGSAYTIRTLVDGGLVEQRDVFVLHPDGSGRLVVLSVRYPPGDAEATKARLLQMLDLVGALEPLA